MKTPKVRKFSSNLCSIPIGLGLLLVGCSNSTTKPEKNIVKAPELPEETILHNGIATYDEGLFKVSLSSWNELRDGYPTSYYSTLAEIKIADAHFFSGDYPSALVAYEEFAKLHPGHEAMPYVRYQIGNCSFKQYKDILHDQAPLQTALKSYEQLIEQHSKSEYVVLARRQIDRCKELQAAYEKYVADFYSRKGLDAAANSRINKLSLEFPGSKALEKVQEEQGQVSIKLNDQANTAGKLPSPPKLVSSALLEDSHYTAGLRSLKDRTTSKVSVIDETPILDVVADKKSEPVRINEIIEVACEETASGAVFVVTTLSPILANPQKSVDDDQESLRFLWKEKNSEFQRENQAELCSANGISLKVNSYISGISLKLSSQTFDNSSFIVLNRPNRVVLSVNSQE